MLNDRVKQAKMKSYQTSSHEGVVPEEHDAAKSLGHVSPCRHCLAGGATGFPQGATVPLHTAILTRKKEWYLFI